MMHMGCRGEIRRIRKGGGMGIELARIGIALKTDSAAAYRAEISVHPRRAFETGRRFARPVPLIIRKPQKPHCGRARSAPATVAMADDLKKGRAAKGKPHPTAQAVARVLVCVFTGLIGVRVSHIITR